MVTIISGLSKAPTNNTQIPERFSVCDGNAQSIEPFN